MYNFFYKFWASCKFTNHFIPLFIQRFLDIAQAMIGEIFGHNRLHVDILRFSFIKLGNILLIPLKWPVIFLQSPTSTGYFSNSTVSSATNCWFSTIIATNVKGVWTLTIWVPKSASQSLNGEIVPWLTTSIVVVMNRAIALLEDLEKPILGFCRSIPFVIV